MLPSQEQKCMWEGSFFMFTQWLTLFLVSWKFLDSNCHLYFLSFGRMNSPTEHIETYLTFPIIKHLGDESFFSSNNGWTFILVSLQVLPWLWFLQTFLSFRGENTPKTHMGCHVALPTRKIPGRLIIFMFCQKWTLCLVFCMVYTWISLIRRISDTKYSHQGHLPSSMTRTHGRWTIFMYFQWQNHIPYFLIVFVQFLWFLKVFTRK